MVIKVGEINQGHIADAPGYLNQVQTAVTVMNNDTQGYKLVLNGFYFFGKDE